MRSESLEFGKAAEDAAAKFLKTKGYKIIERNYRNKFGEIDIIAEQKKVICFIEIKARHTLDFGLPQEAVSGSKQRQISKVALGYLKSKRMLDRPARFDVLGILYKNNQPEISLITDAFGLRADFTF
jgi:putative endonuclease